MSEEWNQDPRNSNWTDANTVRRLTETEVNSSIQLIKNRYVIEASLNHILTNGWSFVGSGQAKRPWSPCNVEGEKKEKGEVLHLFRCYTHTHTHHFVTHNSHTTLSHISFTRIFVTHNFLSHTKLFHTTLSQIPFTHNFVTQAFHTQLCHTQLFHTQLCHIHLFHTQSFTHNFVTYNPFTHNLLHHKLTHTTLSHTALSPNLSCTISFPSCLSHLIFTSACDHWKKLICGVIRSFNFTLFS